MARANKVRRRSVRLTEEEDDALQTLAVTHQVTCSAVLVQLVRAALDQSPGPLSRYAEGLEQLVLETHKIGINLNQIARAANSGRSVVVDDSLLAELIAHVTEVQRFVSRKRDANRDRYVEA